MSRLLPFALAAALATASFGAMAEDMVMSPSASPADKAFMQSMMTMSHDMDAVKPTGNPDQDFVAMMLPHHEGAVAMAKVQLQYGKDPVLRTMAADIVASQDKEIAEMKAWQAKHAK